MPLITNQVSNMDDARMTYIESLNDYCLKLREELRINELIMHSVIKSLSVQNAESSKLDSELTQLREERPDHKPLITTRREDVEAGVEDTLRRATKDMNNRNQRNSSALLPPHNR